MLLGDDEGLARRRMAWFEQRLMLAEEGNNRWGEFSPVSIPGLVGWYDFSDITTLFTDVGRSAPVTVDGDRVRGITDKSGQGNHVSGATGCTYKTAIVNGKAVGRYNLGGAHSSAAYGVALTQPTTIVAVVNLATLGAFEQFYDGILAGNRHLVYLEAGSVWAMFAGTTASSAVAPSASTWYVQVATFNTTTSNAWVNGTQIITNGSVGTNTLTGLKIGQNEAGTVSFAGDLGQLFVYNAALSTANRDALESSLGGQYGITVA